MLVRQDIWHPCLHVFVYQASLASLSTCVHAPGLCSLGLRAFYEGFPVCFVLILLRKPAHMERTVHCNQKVILPGGEAILLPQLCWPLQKKDIGEEKGGLNFNKRMEWENYVSRSRIVCPPPLLFLLHCSSVYSFWNKEKKGISQNWSHGDWTGKRRHVVTCIFISVAHSVLGFLVCYSQHIIWFGGG